MEGAAPGRWRERGGEGERVEKGPGAEDRSRPQPAAREGHVGGGQKERGPRMGGGRSCDPNGQRRGGRGGPGKANGVATGRGGGRALASHDPPWEGQRGQRPPPTGLGYFPDLG